MAAEVTRRENFVESEIQISFFLLLHRAFWNLKLVIYQQMHYLLHLERFNFTQKITAPHNL
jgi:hypothetical protein